MNTADEVFDAARDTYISKLYSEQRAATPGEIAGVKAKSKGLKALVHPVTAVRNKRTKNWSTVANDDGYKATVSAKDDWKGIGFKEGSGYRQVTKPGTGRLL